MTGPYQGDFAVNSTVRLQFDTFAGSTGASITMTGFIVGDINVFKNGGATPRASTAGYTATTDFASLTGLHLIVIDTSDNSDPGFFAAGNEYQVAISAVTVDGQTVRFWAGAFSIERSGGALALIKALAPAGVLSNNAIVAASIAADAITAAKIADGAITAAKIATDAIDNDAIAANAVTEIQSGLATATDLATVAGYIDTEIGSIKGVTDKLDTTLEVDGLVYRFTTNALEQAPAGGGGGTGIINFVYGGEWLLNQANRITFYLQSSAGAAVTGLGSGFTLTLAKNTAAFGASAGTKAEIGNGWYTYLATAGEADTIGTVAVKVTGAGAVEQKLEYVVKQRNAGAIAYTYTVTRSDNANPIEGVSVWFATDSSFANIVFTGTTDTFGVLRDSNGNLPLLDAGTYHIRLQKAGFNFSDDTEVVS